MGKKLTPFVILFVTGNIATAQTWVRVRQVPKQDVFSLMVNNDTVYAGTNDKIYIGYDLHLNWKASVPIDGAGYISAIILFHNKLYAGTANAGVYSSGDKGDSWVAVNKGLDFKSVSKLLVWKDKLYASTFGEGFFAYNESTNQWSAFNNNFAVNIGGNVNDIKLYGSTIIAAAGDNGIFYKYNTMLNSWDYLYYNSTLKPGLQVNALQAEGNTIFAGINGAFSQALLRSEDGGITWQTDTVGLGGVLRFNQASSNVNVLSAGGQKNYLVVNSFNGNNSSRLFQRNKASALGTKWDNIGTFETNNVIYGVEEAGNKIYAALDTGLYYLDQSALPVGLANLTAALRNNGVLLQWQTFTEQNSNYFNIQRSIDGVHFNTIGFTAAAGNSTKVLNYAYSDSESKTYLKTTLYYRVQEVNLDSQSYNSNTVSVESNKQGALFSVSPNPVMSNLFIQSQQDAADAVIHIYDANGKVKYATVASLYSSASTLLNVANLSAGIYFLSIEANGNKMDIKIVKQ